MGNRREDEIIRKTYTCELPGKKGCSVIYHAMTTPELDAFNKLSVIDQKKFEKQLLDNHLKTCFRKQDYVGQTK